MKKYKLGLILWLIFWIVIPGLSFAENRYPFENEKQAHQFQKLTKAFRCLVCQNETLADSEAPLALDLRQQIYQRVQQNESDAEIQNYLVARYGDFVLLKPPLTAETIVLWCGPFLLLSLGCFIVFRVIKRSSVDR